MIMTNSIVELQSLAASQWGMFTSAQAEQLSISKKQLSRMKQDGRLEHIASGVYRFAASGSDAFLDMKAAWLSTNPHTEAYNRLRIKPYDIVIAGRTAAALHQVGDFYASPYTFIVKTRKQTRRAEIQYLPWRDLSTEDTQLIKGLPVTTLERTIADLVRLREDPSLVDNLIRDIFRSGRSIDRDHLATLLSPLAARNGYPKGDGVTFSKSLLPKSTNHPSDI